jgi:hypothetical protein
MFGDGSQFRGSSADLACDLPPPSPHSLAALHERVFRLLPLQNLALGLNELDLAEAFDWSVVVVSKPLTTNPLPTDHLIGG